MCGLQTLGNAQPKFGSPSDAGRNLPQSMMIEIKLNNARFDERFVGCQSSSEEDTNCEQSEALELVMMMIGPLSLVLLMHNPEPPFSLIRSISSVAAPSIVRRSVC